jgi:hypothetical protein
MSLAMSCPGFDIVGDLLRGQGQSRFPVPPSFTDYLGGNYSGPTTMAPANYSGPTTVAPAGRDLALAPALR